MTKVALLTPYSAPVRGGISSFVTGLARVLMDHGDDVAILSGEGSGDSDLHSELGIGRAFSAKASDALARFRPDVIHCHAHWHTLMPGVKYVRNRPATRLIFSFHTTAVPFLRGLLARLLRQTDVVTFVCAAQLAEMRNALHLGGELRILRPATQLEQVDREIARLWRREQRLEDAFPVLAFVGPLEYPRKVAGVVDLVHAFRDLLTTHRKARLFIVGDGALRGRVEDSLKGLEESVTITGYMSDPAIAVENADLYCHISHQEGLPIALLEAMSLGRCVIASRTGGIPEVIDGTNGILVDRSPEEIAEALRALVSDPNRRAALGNAARETISHSYTWSSRWSQVSEIYGLGN